MLPKWRNFEDEVSQLFELAGFSVDKNSGVAKPRQTDLYASDNHDHFLVEVKDRAKRIDINDIDSLRARLNRTAPEVVGIIITTGLLTKGAKSAIEQDRSRHILAFDGGETKLLRSRRKNLRALIEQKRTALRSGRLWTATPSNSVYLNVALPKKSVVFKVGTTELPYFETKTGFDRASLALRIPDSGWGSPSGEGARLNIELSLSTVEDLRDVLGYLHKHFGLTRDGFFSIHQAAHGWHGMGVEAFLSAVTSWKLRYKQVKLSVFHHSEEFSYFDAFEGGWIQVVAQQRVGDGARNSSTLYHSEIVIQLPGLPLDSSRYLKLAQYVGNSWAHFVYVSERWTTSYRFKQDFALDVVGTVIDPAPWSDGVGNERTVIAVIAKNPFLGKRALGKSLPEDISSALQQIKNDALILCSVRDYHPEDSEVGPYKLQEVEVTEGGRGPIIRLIGTWDDLPSRVKGRE